LLIKREIVCKYEVNGLTINANNNGMGWKIRYSAVFLDFAFDIEILFGLCDCPNLYPPRVLRGALILF
jgi:hypothetical protein